MEKIVFVMPWHVSEWGGGAEVQANYLAMELATRGFEVYYICQTLNENKIGSTQKVDGVCIHWLKPSGKLPWLDQNKYLKPLKAIQPDYILQRLSSNVTYVLGSYSSKNKCKMVWFCTDNKSPDVDFHYSKFKECSNIKTIGLIKYILFATSNKIMDYYRNRGMKHVDIAFSQNNFQYTHIKKHFNLKSYRMISGHPLPLKNYSSKERFENQVVLWCGNLGIHKRPKLFIELAKRMQCTNLKFIMVGGHSDKAYVDDLLKNKPSNLYCTGQLSFEKALAYFDKPTLLVNTSISEGFSNTYIQAWLRGMPTLVFDADPDSIIEKNRLGFNVASLDEGIEKLKLLVSDYVIYKEISKNVSAYGRKNHSIRAMTDSFLKTICDESITLS